MTIPTQYEVTCAREIDGQYRAVGDIIAMTPAQAKYYLPPYGSGLKPVAAKPATGGKRSDAVPGTAGKPAGGKRSDAVQKTAGEPTGGKAARPKA